MSKAAEALAEALLQRRRELVGENPSITVAEVERALASLIDYHPDVKGLLNAAMFAKEALMLDRETTGPAGKWALAIGQLEEYGANWLPSSEKSDE